MRQSITKATTLSPASDLQFDWIMVLLTLWGIVGLFLDGWAHTNLPRLETFFTPWHGVLYSGYVAVAATLIIRSIRNLGEIPRENWARRWLEAIPAAYVPSLLGVVIFAVSGVGDLLWHVLFGIERSVEALLSPTHLGLAIGGGLVATGPLRAAWQRSASEKGMSWRQLGPALASIIFTLSLLTFFTEYVSPFVNPWPVYTGPFFAEFGPLLGIAGIIMYSGMLMSFVLLALRRWQLPWGVFTLIFTLNTGLMSVFNPDIVPYLLPGVFLAGVAADIFYQTLRPSQERVTLVRFFAFIVPTTFFVCYFLNLAIVGPLQFQGGITWSIHFWTGACVIAGITGFLLSFVMFPPAIPNDG